MLVYTTTTGAGAPFSILSPSCCVLCIRKKKKKKNLSSSSSFYCRQSNKRPFVKAAQNVLKAWWPSRQWFLPSLPVFFMSSDCRSCKIEEKKNIPKQKEEEEDELLFWTTDTKKSSVSVYTCDRRVCAHLLVPTSCLVRFDNILYADTCILSISTFNLIKKIESKPDTFSLTGLWSLSLKSNLAQQQRNFPLEYKKKIVHTA